MKVRRDKKTGKEAYHRESRHYAAEPAALVFNEDSYYVTVYDAKHNSTANCRIGQNIVKVFSEPVFPKALAENNAGSIE